MRTLLYLKIKKGEGFKVLIPSYKAKRNIFYPITKKLNRFDEVSVLYIDKTDTILVYNDMLCDALISCYDKLINILNNKLNLPCDISIGSIGYYLSESKKVDDEPYDENKYIFDRNNLNRFWLWSTAGKAQTFIYSAGKIIYIEICPVYRWKEDESINAYGDFLNNYKPYKIIKCNRSIIKQWLEKIKTVLTKVGEDPDEKVIDNPSIKPIYLLSQNQVTEIGWKNVEPAMQALLIKHGLFTKNGKLKKQTK